MLYLLGFLGFLFGAIFSIWWLILPVLLFLMTWEKHLITARFNFLSGLNWVFLEIHIPPRVTRSPKAMEEVFNALHGVYRRGSWYARFVKGYIPAYYVFELIGNNGKLRFFIRCLNVHKELVKSRVYSQYPEAKVEETENPLKNLPEKVPEPTYDIFGTDLKLAKDSAYPLRTYEVWEKLPEEHRIDPISALSEGASQLGEDEWIVFQIFAMPVAGTSKDWGDEWVTKGKKIVDDLLGRKKETERGPFEIIAEFVVNLLLAPFREIKWKESTKEEEKWPSVMKLTPGERNTLEAIEKKISKHGFWGGARFAYIARKDTFQKNMPKNSGLLFGFIKIFGSEDVNSLERIRESITTIDYPSYFWAERIFFRKRFLYTYVHGRWRTDFGFYVLNPEELASLFHIPVEFVPAPGIERRVVVEKPPSPEVPVV
jgi:hypothetical protein